MRTGARQGIGRGFRRQSGNNRGATESATLAILGSLTFCHLLNDLMQSLLPALYPMLKSSFTLSFTQIGLITFTYQVTASLLQPLIGRYTDRRPRSYLLPVGMSFTLLGLLLLSAAGSFVMLLAAAALAGTGSAVFHPEASRIARLASGGRHGFAQSFFQVGGNIGSALARCWRRSSSCRAACRASPGSRWRRCWR